MGLSVIRFRKRDGALLAVPMPIEPKLWEEFPQILRADPDAKLLRQIGSVSAEAAR